MLRRLLFELKARSVPVLAVLVCQVLAGLMRAKSGMPMPRGGALVPGYGA
jgi:hypothetical protein